MCLCHSISILLVRTWLTRKQKGSPGVLRGWQRTKRAQMGQQGQRGVAVTRAHTWGNLWSLVILVTLGDPLWHEKPPCLVISYDRSRVVRLCNNDLTMLHNILCYVVSPCDSLWTKLFLIRDCDRKLRVLGGYHPRIGDPGAFSQGDAIFSGERYSRGESLLQELKSPWELFLRKWSKSVSLIGQKNIFLANRRAEEV